MENIKYEPGITERVALSFGDDPVFSCSSTPPHENFRMQEEMKGKRQMYIAPIKIGNLFICPCKAIFFAIAAPTNTPN
ncbi:hypothetical protein GCM10023093_30590 [Nemorincola caseinilytica]|uniref:Uncharacterized protein n=1 Tax=Nemorincola caseinilytica TaxID=2054315 RepID=A0ABP8NP34_9BACT